MMAGLAVGIAVALVGAWTAVGYMSTKGIQEPAYTVVEKKRGYEIREYAPYIRAEVTLEGAYRDTLYGGFRQVADYIFGNNTKSEKVAMTAPVIQEKSEKIAMTAPVIQEAGEGKNTYTVAFVMPREYTLETLPKPNNPNMAFREVPARRFAVLKFGGYATERRVERKRAQLVKSLDRDGVKAAGTALVAQYDPPWTPFYMRRNEIQVPL
ncbi:MAG: heme-binding protein [Candidatus Hydrogenedentes bacterium]|nr:heme-binding protein [Candidatus Hydrogenedentota bacterium]